MDGGVGMAWKEPHSPAFDTGTPKSPSLFFESFPPLTPPAADAEDKYFPRSFRFAISVLTGRESFQLFWREALSMSDLVCRV
jgi:hypothetical protein